MFNQVTFEIWRLTVTTGEKRSFQNTGEKLSGVLDPVDAEFAALSGSSFGKSFKVFSRDNNSTIKENDRLVLGSDTYEVRGYQKFDQIPKHIELIVEKVIKQ